jgi:hypothetical protein
MALEGTIRDFGLPDIFQLIGLQRKTGLLTLKSDKETVLVTFENGMVVMADSSSRRLEDRLGNVLVKQGKLPKERLDDALQTQRATLQRLGHILVSNNSITSKDLKDALQVQVSQIVFKVFRWRDGEYHFAPTESVDYDRENFTPMSADFILMEGIRMVDEWPIIEKKIPSLDIVFRTVVDSGGIEIRSAEGAAEDAVAGLGETKRSGPSTGKIQLSGEEERVYRRIDGTRTVQGIIDATGSGEFEVCRTLFDLLNRNIIAPVGRGMVRDSTGPMSEVFATRWVPGYLMLGVVLLLALGGAAMNWREPFRVVGLPPVLMPVANDLKDWAMIARVARVEKAVVAWYLARGRLPAALKEVVESGILDEATVEARPMRYTATGERGFRLEVLDGAGNPLPGTRVERVLPPISAAKSR